MKLSEIRAEIKTALAVAAANKYQALDSVETIETFLSSPKGAYAVALESVSSEMDFSKTHRPRRKDTCAFNTIFIVRETVPDDDALDCIDDMISEIEKRTITTDNTTENFRTGRVSLQDINKSGIYGFVITSDVVRYRSEP